MEKLTTTEAERFAISAARVESCERTAWLEGYRAGVDFMIAQMVNARGLTGKWRVNDDATEFVKVEE